MSRLLPVVMAALIIVTSISATPAEARKECPTYLTNLVVDFVNLTPNNVQCGGTVNITVHVVYPDGTPVTLLPETLSFMWSGPCIFLVLENVPVVPTGVPGYYTRIETVTCCVNRTLTVTTTTTCNQTCCFPTGTAKVYVLVCSASDGLGNYGPTDDVSSDETITEGDSSKVNIGSLSATSTSVGQTTTQGKSQDLLATYAIPIFIAAVLVIAILLAARALRKRGAKH